MNSLLKFITCGSVDDGKSTLIGHMLYDAKLLFADQKRALELDSKVGSRGGAIDYSLLLDGLMAEREQGITIDVAYRYFTTENRSFIVADTPGHEEYTRNMAVGASFAELAVILVDATQGVLVQTRRHTRICSLMGIEHFVFAINKMDLINYDANRFEKIEREIKMMAAEYDYKSIKILPVSATEGDNVTVKSTKMPWYKGESLLTYLENIQIHDDSIESGFTMPVQRVCRPDRTFRGFQGQIESGKIKVGDEITALPSNEKAEVKGIIDAGKEVTESSRGHAVTISLDREVDVSRGCVLVNNAKPKTGNEVHADAIYKNEIAACDIAVSDKIVFEKFKDNHALGSMILIDRITNMTSACGVIMHALRRTDNLTWHEMDITRDFRAQQKGQTPKTIWLTGLSGSGKSTLANELEKHLAALGKHTMLLDGDNVRMGLNKTLGFKEADRIENIRRIAEVAKLMNDAGLIVITSFISPYVRDRRNAREIIGEDSFIEVYVSTPVEECEKRDVKGLYKKARAGEIPNFTGISSPYETPEHPEVTIDTTGKSLADSVDYVMAQLEDLLN